MSRLVSFILIAISIVGVIAIPFGDPQFLARAVGLELAFAALAVLTWKGFRKPLYVCIPIAALVIIGNSLAPPHVEIMTTFSKPLNAVLLIVGGYLLQIALIMASGLELRRPASLGITKETN